MSENTVPRAEDDVLGGSDQEYDRLSENQLDVEIQDMDRADISLWGDESKSGSAAPSDTAVHEVAKQLLFLSAPLITVSFKDTTFTLFPLDNNTAGGPQAASARGHMLADGGHMHKSFSELIAAIRAFLEREYGRLELATKELLLTFPDLDLCITEDNTYSKNISMNDIASIFNILRENSLERDEPNIPDHLHIVLTLCPRFVAKYNDLVELVDSHASFSHVRGFSNDRQHPLVIDGNEPVPERYSEVVLKSSPTEDDSDELLEIIDGPA
ncbi:AFR276Cp [Eremothecium gossypii ATCC 10895]|uniref:AFR276Cp n=1 Tax=Eremothecium gossypii (strain ATCC 10895 / CBS 109.51 / FGSC 9923 / NRRL Y-1056) TaxID=284811 RepID=Q753N6_EREGS|nr:AFR276Cp [Eremothecium gossypii ATCC 10895]AAS53647.2 AFR276Cp [Eremothecium gossypii ATCC 10895]